MDKSMRDQYITKSLVTRRFAELKAFFNDREKRAFLDRREELVKGVKTREARKYLFFETIAILNDPSKWKTLI